ncbi:MAG TPA: hypothetical protein ENH62_08085 [Marinobacter sp.]|uniref:Uncharacterized protein n=1 Tax=marine sediment metagenome TaxID=412755 RepID=A0A0F9E9A5_9ZZZZ|nr:hypothetical protein [Marinobacter sp.]
MTQSSKKKQKAPESDDGFVVRRSKFSGAAAIAAATEIRERIRDICGKVLKLPSIVGISQYEEMVRDYRTAIDKGGVESLPYFSDGIGSKQPRLVSCIAAEISCIIVAYWAFNLKTDGPTAECVNDHLEYLDNLVADPTTLRIVKLGNCRYRAANSRIDAGERLNEKVE